MIQKTLDLERLDNILNNQINFACIDWTGKCNCGCWFCPVRYKNNPQEHVNNMSPKLLDKILKNIIEERGRMFPENFRSIYTSHYNELLLHPNLREMFDVMRENGFNTILLSNGRLLTPQIADLCIEYRDVVGAISLNIPTLDEEMYILQTHASKPIYDNLINNLKYINQKFKEEDYLVNEKYISIRINVANTKGMTFNGGIVQMLKEGNQFGLVEDEESHINEFKKIVPNIDCIYVNNGLCDRAGILHNECVISNQVYISNIQRKLHNPTTDCNRLYWLQINANGNLFTCCNDYYMENIFGNIKDNTIGELWKSQAHIDAIESTRAGICRRCVSAKWE
jgi:MoaA/NifB/PqqE/SkfB family radical SAM enzyme